MNQNKVGTLSKLYVKLNRLNENRYLYSIRTAFVSTMPLMLVGAYAVVLNQLPIPSYQEMMARVFGENWRMFGGLVFNATTQIVTLFVIFQICANLTRWYQSHQNVQAHSGIGGMVGLASYIVITVPVDNPEGLLFGMTGATGLFVGIVVSVVTSELFIHLSSRKRVIRLLSDDPNVAVPQSFSSIWPAVLIIGIFAVLRICMVAFGMRAGLSDVVNDVLRLPFKATGDAMGTALVYNLFSHVMWLFGIHGNNVLDGVAKTVLVPALQENIAAVAAGATPPHLITKTLFDAFVYMGGSGTTLALLIALAVFGKGRSFRTLMRFALPNSLFNINEPLVFGIPLVLNPVYAVPFVLTPMVMFLTTALSMKLGLVPYTIAEVSWATPIFYSGYVSTGSFAGVLLQLVNLVIGVLIYAPFVKLGAKMAQDRFEGAYKELSRVVTTEYSASPRRLVNRVDEVGAAARRLANQLGGALAGGEMYMVYQPIVDAANHSIHSVEALLRWKHPQFGFINPMVVVALAEEVGLIDKLGLWTMEQAVVQRLRWNEQGLQDFHVSVNVSSPQLDKPEFSRQVLEMLKKYDVPAHQLQVEITETVALVENENTRHNLQVLHKAGVSIAMDDFGVGHSSLLYLRTQPITTLKIDGSLSRDINKHPANLGIVSTINDLCKMLNVDTVVEFVDNKEQLAMLMDIGPFLIQGYLFSAPLRGDEVPDFVEDIGTHPAFS